MLQKLWTSTLLHETNGNNVSWSEILVVCICLEVNGFASSVVFSHWTHFYVY